jgi:molecular chaperone GrpE
MSNHEQEVRPAAEIAADPVVETEEVLDGQVVQDGPSGSDDEADAQQDVLADLRKLQDDILRARADYDNLRKQSRKREADGIARVKARVLEDLLPLVDSFEAALLHSEDQEGLQLLFKQLTQALQQNGLEEVRAEGLAFDPRLHEAVTTVEDPAVERETVKEVYRKGYALGEQLLRPAMVVVARPADPSGDGKGAGE